MSQEILSSGDQVIYRPNFGPAVVTVQPGTLTGTGWEVTIQGAVVCVQGDEASAAVSGCPYTAGGYTIPGAGTLSIAALGTDQLSRRNSVKGKPVMLRGTTFTAQFQVTVPAQMPTSSGSVPDPVPLYTGSGAFQTVNGKVLDKG